METRFLFQITPYDSQLLLPQVSEALKLRTDLLARERYPGLWSATDKLRVFSHGKTRSKTRSRIIGVLFLLLGIFLFIPGITAPDELTGPLFIGLLGILAGIFNIWLSRKNKKNPFEKSAKLLMESKSDLSVQQDIKIVFGELGIELPNESGTSETIPYETFECAVQGPDLFLFVFDTRVIVLQKCDLIVGETENFWSFITEKVSRSATFF